MNRHCSVLAAALVVAVFDLTAASRLVGQEAEGETPSLRHAFVTSTTGTGDLSTWAGSGGVDGVTGANNVCQARAEAAGLATAGVPAFRAWISIFNTTAGDEIDAWCNVQGLTGSKVGGTPCDGGTQIAAGPWARTDGIVFGDSLAQLTTNGSYVPLSRDEFGVAVVSTPLFMTGTFLTGVRSSADCTGWTVTTGQLQPGSTQSASNWGSFGSLTLCSATYRLACLEVGVGVPIAKPSAPGHLVFVTSTSGTGDLSSWTESTEEHGIAAGDEICRVRAAAARLPEPESFHAWLSDSTHDAACWARGLTGKVSTGCVGSPPPDAPYRRIDGFQLANNFAGLLDGALDAAPSSTESGGFSSNPVLTATVAAGTLSATGDCDDWELTTGNLKYGSSNGLDAKWTESGAALCTGNMRLYCFSSAVVIFWDTFESGNLARWSGVEPPLP